MTTRADRLLPDQLWQRIQPLLPPPPSRARGGAPRTVPDRACLAALLFLARTSTPGGRAPPRPRPGLLGPDPVHGAHPDSLGAAAGGRVRLRQRDHLLAAVCRV